MPLQGGWLMVGLLGIALPTSAQASQPQPHASVHDEPLVGPSPSADPTTSQLQLQTPGMVALQPEMAGFLAEQQPVHAKRGKDRTFDTSLGESDPRQRQLPRTHRFRLTLHADWIRLSQTLNPSTGEFQRFHFAPMMLDLGYQAQFLKYVMVRVAVAVGGNPANTRNSMPLAVFPQAYLGVQHKVFGAALGYGFDWTIPPTFGAVAQSTNALEQPVITRNHVVMGELSLTSRIDKVAMTFSLAIGGVQSDLSHYSTVNRKWRPFFGFQAGGFFDGTKRREKKAKKRAEAAGTAR